MGQEADIEESRMAKLCIEASWGNPATGVNRFRFELGVGFGLLFALLRLAFM